MRKAKKNLHRMPKLSLLDQTIYWTVLLLLCISYFALAFSPMLLQDKIAFAEDNVIASRAHSSTLWVLVPWMTYFLITFILWITLYQDRRPIFGLKNFKYGPPAWPKVYPLFMKDKPYVWVSARKQQEKKQVTILLIVVLLVSFIPFSWSLYGRDCLYADSSICRYSILNSRKQEILPQEIETVEFSPYSYTTGKYVKNRHWGVAVTMTTATGKRFTFQNRDFSPTDRRQPLSWLKTLLQLKKQFDPHTIRYKRLDDLKYVVWDYTLSDEEEKLLYQLFSQSVQ